MLDETECDVGSVHDIETNAKLYIIAQLGLVVQSPISTNPGLTLNKTYRVNPGLALIGL